ncbi:uncharacterized protein ATNIH1004_007421 [Aspergillus tanneri]|uniref:Uncharacterized protein n=1 Tax=Aspergillus tanneri TaxID=1220188 RepID=A0A5M9MNG8_9EURO|nr:uncharacterized protein ATNIH1004_007421 [Aspergillus tanneri]KAA8645999.1 hypothetical protein ATNIH1004_007421 [Aspergillus tanneri]
MNGGKSYADTLCITRTPSHFLVKIPDSIPSAEAAPMMCGGVTLYSPLKHNGCGPRKCVGIIVVAISRKVGKSEDVLQMVADGYIATDDELDWATKYVCSLTSSSAECVLRKREKIPNKRLSKRSSRH